MGGDSKPVSETAKAVAAAANSPAALKLAQALKSVCDVPQNILDYVAGEKRIVEVTKARAEGALIQARAQAEIDKLRAETAQYVLDREMRKARNRRLIVAEAFRALPPGTDKVSDAKPSEAFIHGFFDDFDGIGEPEMQTIVGRLLAGEVLRPGSYHRKTLRVLRDLESTDFQLFSRLCPFAWDIAQPTPIIFDPNDDVCLSYGLNFNKCELLDTLGLVVLSPLGKVRTNLPRGPIGISYGPTQVFVVLKPGSSTLKIGRVDFTHAGLQLFRLARTPTSPEILEYVMTQWRSHGHTVTLSASEANAAASTADAATAGNA